MRRSKSEIYMHVVWATWQRRSWLTPTIEREVYRCIEDETRKQQGIVLALNGMPDHVHLLLQMPASLAAAHLMKQVKGVSSHFINNHCGVEEHFHWQENYGVFSLSRSHLPRAIKYVQHQKQRHARDTIGEQWEETDEAAEQPDEKT